MKNKIIMSGVTHKQIIPRAAETKCLRQLTRKVYNFQKDIVEDITVKYVEKISQREEIIGKQVGAISLLLTQVLSYRRNIYQLYRFLNDICYKSLKSFIEKNENALRKTSIFSQNLNVECAYISSQKLPNVTAYAFLYDRYTNIYTRIMFCMRINNDNIKIKNINILIGNKLIMFPNA